MNNWSLHICLFSLSSKWSLCHITANATINIFLKNQRGNLVAHNLICIPLNAPFFRISRSSEHLNRSFRIPQLAGWGIGNSSLFLSGTICHERLIPCQIPMKISHISYFKSSFLAWTLDHSYCSNFTALKKREAEQDISICKSTNSQRFVLVDGKKFASECDAIQMLYFI